METQKVRRGLGRKGFLIENDNKDVYCRFYYRGIKTKIRSKVGGHSKKKYKTYPDIFLAQMKRDLYFDDREQLINFIECPFSQDKYESILIMKGKIIP